MNTRVAFLSMVISLIGCLAARAADTTIVRFTTSRGNIDVQMLSDEAPQTVANFLTYVNSGAYTNSIIHVSVPGFIIQGGGYILPNGAFPVTNITAGNPVASEASVSNTRGTLAMALATGPGSATCQWFFNLADNPSLDSATANGAPTGGPYTVFGNITNSSGLSVMDAIGGEPFYDASSALDNNFTMLPLLNYDSTAGLVASDFVMIYSVAVLTTQQPAAFGSWQTSSFTTQQQADPTFTAATATPFSDGTSNLLKYVYDINPSTPMSASDRVKLPTIGTAEINSVNMMTLTFQENASLAGVTVHVQTSTDLQTWTTMDSPTIVTLGVAPVTKDPLLQVQVPITVPSTFIRLQVTQP